MRYHQDHEKSKGSFTAMASYPEMERVKKNTQEFSDINYRGIQRRVVEMERRRVVEHEQETTTGTHTHTHMRTCTCTCTHTHTHTHIHAHTHMHTHAHAHAHAHAHTCTCTCTCTHTYTPHNIPTYTLWVY